MFYITIFIFVKEGKETVFHEFEELVIPILDKYNGQVYYRIRPTNETYITCVGEQPYEVHLVAFDTEQDFKNYTNDEERKTFMHLKEQSIKTTIAIKGTTL